MFVSLYVKSKTEINLDFHPTDSCISLLVLEKLYRIHR